MDAKLIFIGKPMAVQTADAVVKSCLHESLEQLRGPSRLGSSALPDVGSLRLKRADEGLVLLLVLSCGFPRGPACMGSTFGALLPRSPS